MSRESRTSVLYHSSKQPLAWRRGQSISAETFLQDVEQASRSLPEKRYVFNLCEDRYRFMVGFAAALHRKQITLMPQNATAGAINGLSEDFPDSYCLVEKSINEISAEQIEYGELMISDKLVNTGLVTIDPDQIAAILFTSGSTGKPKMHAKDWRTLTAEAALALQHFPFLSRNISSILATVPSQHMYGLATAILFPWQGAISIDTGRPFFPADILASLSRLPAPRVLITTPLHLRACAAASLDWPPIEFIVSATAPLSESLAADVEREMLTQVFEIYGSTETGSIAGRRTTENSLWCLYPNITISPQADGCEVNGGHLMDKVLLNDSIKLESGGEFHLLGRDSDILKIAGKRASLSDLNHQLMDIPGVIDGTFLPPDDEKQENQRLSALVVAPSLSKHEILQALGKTIDEVFLPRPLHFVTSLPRNSTGKLPRRDIDKLLISMNNNQHSVPDSNGR